MTDFAVTVPELTRSADSARGISAELLDELDRLRHRADAVLTESWLGGAADAFDRAWSEWHAAACDLVAALTELADEVEACATSYRLGDELGSQVLLRAAS
jgi:WXG100 family type VII secretion target